MEAVMEKSRNVVRMPANQNLIFKHIQSYLRNKSNRSENTERAYRSDIQQFFTYMKGKDLESLTESDLHILNSDMMDYQTFLLEQNSNNTTTRKIASVISLFSFLKKNGYSVDPDMLRVDALTKDEKAYGFLSPDEIDKMIALVGEHRNGEEKKLLIMLAVRTSLRKNALLNLRWRDISKSRDKEDVYIISSTDQFDKGKVIYKEIHRKMYDKLLILKTDGENIFNIGERTVDVMMKKLCKDMGIEKERNITFHSLKKAGVEYVYTLTGDIRAAQMQAGHSNIEVTGRTYLPKEVNIAGMAMDEDIDKDIFNKMTKEQLIELMESIDGGLGLQLRRKAVKMMG